MEVGHLFRDGIGVAVIARTIAAHIGAASHRLYLVIVVLVVLVHAFAAERGEGEEKGDEKV